MANVSQSTLHQVATSSLSSYSSSLNPSQSLIFVSIISYRDPDTVATLRSIFSRATNPNRVFVTIIWQYQPSQDAPILFHELKLDEFPSNHIRQLFLPHHQAKGPCWARYLAQENIIQQRKLHHHRDNNPSSLSSSQCGDDFYLQLDSHMRLAPDWDTKLLEEWLSTSDSNAILTAYPPGFERDAIDPFHVSPSHQTHRPEDPPPLLCASNFDDKDGMVRLVGRLLATTTDKINDENSLADSPPSSSSILCTPLPCLFYAAGFCFGPIRMVLECPYDPHLKNLFFGEELSMLARLWTSGFNMYSPTRNFAYHCWTRSYRPTFRELATSAADSQQRIEYEADEIVSRCRVKTLLAIPFNDTERAILEASVVIDRTLLHPLKPYALGSVRTLKEFSQHVGIDFTRQQISVRAKNGGLEPSRFKPTIQPKQFDLIMQMIKQHQQEK